jgi:hypothetical protein
MIVSIAGEYRVRHLKISMLLHYFEQRLMRERESIRGALYSQDKVLLEKSKRTR